MSDPTAITDFLLAPAPEAINRLPRGLSPSEKHLGTNLDFILRAAREGGDLLNEADVFVDHVYLERSQVELLHKIGMQLLAAIVEKGRLDEETARAIRPLPPLLQLIAFNHKKKIKTMESLQFARTAGAIKPAILEQGIERSGAVLPAINEVILGLTELLEPPKRPTAEILSFAEAQQSRQTRGGNAAGGKPSTLGLGET